MITLADEGGDVAKLQQRKPVLRVTCAVILCWMDLHFSQQTNSRDLLGQMCMLQLADHGNHVV